MRPKAQSLTEAIQKIIDGFDEFVEAATVRAKSNEWTDLHIQYLQDIHEAIIPLKYQLAKLSNETW